MSLSFFILYTYYESPKVDPFLDPPRALGIESLAPRSWASRAAPALDPRVGALTSSWIGTKDLGASTHRMIVASRLHKQQERKD